MYRIVHPRSIISNYYQNNLTSIRIFSERRSAGFGATAPFAFLNAASADREKASQCEGGFKSPNNVAILYWRVDDALVLNILVILTHFVMNAWSDLGHVIWVCYTHRRRRINHGLRENWLGIPDRYRPRSPPYWIS